MKNMHRVVAFACACLLTGLLTVTAHAGEPAQYPLLTRSSAVEPNLVLLFDDSNSMDYEYVYQDRRTNMWGVTDPASVAGDKRPPTDQYARCAPAVNKIFYNPENLYRPPVNPDGTPRAPGSTATAYASAPCTKPNGRPLIYLYQSGHYDLLSSYTEYAIGPSGTFPKSAKRTDCAGATCTYGEEIQNFANWFNYYRRRLNLAKNSINLAFSEMPSTIRLGWGGMNSIVGANALASGVSNLNYDTRVRLQAWLDSLTKNTTQQGTPSLQGLDAIGKYFMRSDSDGPWGSTPNYAAPSIAEPASVSSKEPKSRHASCRRSYAMLVTDGYYTDALTTANTDGVNGPNIVGPNGAKYQYTASPPFKDNYSNTMADVAMKYWINDLRTDLTNNVEPVKGGDPAFWQHMNFHALSIGLEGTLAQTPTTTTALTTGKLNWPAPTPNTLSAVDDMWHATMNGRGNFINVTNGDELEAAMKGLVASILKTSASQGGVAVSTANLVAGSMKFVPVYTSNSWTGNLIANKLDPVTGNEIGVLWQAETIDSSTGLESTNTLGFYQGRKIFAGNKPGVTPKAVTFTNTSITAAGLNKVMAGPVDNDLVIYLRGNRAGEVGDDAPYRKREALLGDIVNSNPTFIGPSVDFGYARLPNTTQAGSYGTFLGQKNKSGNGIVFIGANDGMLHAFRESDGKEIFAYIPHAVLPYLPLLANKDYVHRYYVDGPTIQADFHDGTAWKNALVATTGAGAKSVFAIDTTSGALNDTSVLWEVHDGVSGFEEMGNVLSDVQIGPLRNGQWAAVFGNGYYSKSGRAQLFIVNMATGALIAKIDTLAVGNNGLGGVRLVLNDKNEIVGAYGGDLLGNLWRFDLGSANAGDWKVGHGGTPLIRAKDANGVAQPFTAAPHVVAHPDGGWIVVAATGKFFDALDLQSTGVQSVYGLRDPVSFADPSATPTPAVITASQLVQQSILQDLTVSRTVSAFDDKTSSQVISYYSVSVNPVDWKTKQGWFFNLPASGQRTVYPVAAFRGRLAKVDTIVPGAVSTDPCTASSPGIGYNYVIDALTGGSPQSAFIDTNADGVVDSNDILGASGYSTALDGRDVVVGKSGAPDGIGRSLILDSSGGAILTQVSDCVSGAAECAPPQCKPGDPGCPLTCTPGDEKCSCKSGDPTCTPKSYKIIKRTWRQLYLR